MNTLELWNKFEKTDSRFVKDFNKAGFRGSAINPMYIVRELTKEFGPCGIGWKLEIEDEKYVEGPVLSDGVSRSMVHVVRGVLRYVVDGKWCGTGPQYGQTMMVGENKNGVYCDEEAPKKSCTDLLSKCASLIGVAQDIYLGGLGFKDNKYTAEEPAKAAPKAEKPKKTTTKKAPKKEEPKAWPETADEWVENILAAQDTGELIDALAFVSDTELRADKPQWRLICKAINDRLREIGERGSEDWNDLVSCLKDEKAYLAA